MTEDSKTNADEGKMTDAATAAAAENSDTISEADKLREELAAKETEAKNNYERFLRQVAEFDNLKKRTARDREEISRFANEALIKDLLSVVDNLERAVAHASGGGNGKPLVEGVEMVLKGLLDVLAKHGVTPISAIGEPFDPAKHEAMTQVESDNHEPNSVVEQLQKGYALRDRLLRPALVCVAKPSKTREKKNAETTVENEPGDD
jgi:molecular chaperone GrpE